MLLEFGKILRKKSKKKLRIGTKLVLTALEADRDFGSISFGIDQEDFALIKSRKKGTINKNKNNIIL